jgi:hypothetical protein
MRFSVCKSFGITFKECLISGPSQTEIFLIKNKFENKLESHSFLFARIPARKKGENPIC